MVIFAFFKKQTNKKISWNIYLEEKKILQVSNSTEGRAEIPGSVVYYSTWQLSCKLSKQNPHLCLWERKQQVGHLQSTSVKQKSKQTVETIMTDRQVSKQQSNREENTQLMKSFCNSSQIKAVPIPTPPTYTLVLMPVL